MCVCARSTCACASGTRYAARIRDETRPTIVATVEETGEPSPSLRDNRRHEIFQRSRFSRCHLFPSRCLSSPRRRRKVKRTRSSFVRFDHLQFVYQFLQRNGTAWRGKECDFFFPSAGARTILLCTIREQFPLVERPWITITVSGTGSAFIHVGTFS